MNKTKKIALISFIIFMFSCLASIITAPFAVKSGIVFYNQLVDEALASQEELTETSALPETVKNLSLSLDGWAYVEVLPSENGQIYFEFYDGGFFKGAMGEVSVSEDGASASVDLKMLRNQKITKENIRTGLLAEINDYNARTFSLHLPQDATLNLEESYMLDNVFIGSTPFANREQLLLDAGFSQLENVDLSHYISRISDLKSSIVSYQLPPAGYDEYSSYSVSTFTEQTQHLYQEILNCRQEMLQNVYGTHYRKAVPNADYLLADQLTQAEKECDLLETQLNYLYEDMAQGRITDQQYTALKAEKEGALQQARSIAEQLEQQFNVICFPDISTALEDPNGGETVAPQEGTAPLEPVVPEPVVPAP